MKAAGPTIARASTTTAVRPSPPPSPKPTSQSSLEKCYGDTVIRRQNISKGVRRDASPFYYSMDVAFCDIRIICSHKLRPQNNSCTFICYSQRIMLSLHSKHQEQSLIERTRQPSVRIRSPINRRQPAQKGSHGGKGTMWKQHLFTSKTS